jgi:adenine-specific DNA-methyltransferase
MRLLKQSGILVITIDDYEMHRLVMLLDDLPFSSEVLGVVPIKNNPAGRSTVRGFAVAHEYAVGLVFRREGEHCIVDLLEPHDPGLSDSLSKAHGLCNFAENYGDRFGRIEWIKCEGSQIKRLNLNSFKVRSEVLKTTVDGAINNLFDAFGTTESRVAVP